MVRVIILFFSWIFPRFSMVLVCFFQKDSGKGQIDAMEGEQDAT